MNYVFFYFQRNQYIVFNFANIIPNFDLTNKIFKKIAHEMFFLFMKGEKG